MQQSKRVDIFFYLLLTVVNFGATLLLTNLGNWWVLLIVFLAVMINQASLIYASELMLGVNSEERENGKIFALFLVKFLALAGGIWFGMQNLIGNSLIIIVNYIFQLIILSLSIKRYKKKN